MILENIKNYLLYGGEYKGYVPPDPVIQKQKHEQWSKLTIDSPLTDFPDREELHKYGTWQDLHYLRDILFEKEIMARKLYHEYISKLHTVL